jgi:hypothetical protein
LTITCALLLCGRGPIRFLPLFAISVSAADFQFDAKGVTATVTPFATTYWSCVGTSCIPADRQAISSTAMAMGSCAGSRQTKDGDWFVHDDRRNVRSDHVATEPQRAEVAPLPFPAKAFLRDGNAFSRFVMNVADDMPTKGPLQVLWVRPGEGAWSDAVSDGTSTIDELHATPSELMIDLRNLRPVGVSPAAPPGVQAGDFLVLQKTSGEFWIGGRVSADHLAEAAGGGVILHVSTWAEEDDKKATITLARIDGTEGVVSVHYETWTVRPGQVRLPASSAPRRSLGRSLRRSRHPGDRRQHPGSPTFTVTLSEPFGATLGVASPLPFDY